MDVWVLTVDIEWWTHPEPVSPRCFATRAKAVAVAQTLCDHAPVPTSPREAAVGWSLQDDGVHWWYSRKNGGTESGQETVCVDRCLVEGSEG